MEARLMEQKQGLFNLPKVACLSAKASIFTPIRIALSEDAIQVESKRVKLRPGMPITAEVKTGTRRLIEFFLSPLLRYKQESIRES